MTKLPTFNIVTTMCSLSLAAGGLYFRSPKFDTFIDHIGWEAIQFAPVLIRIPARIFYGVFCQDVDLNSNTIMVIYSDYSSAQSKSASNMRNFSVVGESV